MRTHDPDDLTPLIDAAIADADRSRRHRICVPAEQLHVSWREDPTGLTHGQARTTVDVTVDGVTYTLTATGDRVDGDAPGSRREAAAHRVAAALGRRVHNLLHPRVVNRHTR